MWFRLILLVGLLFAAVNLLPHMRPGPAPQMKDVVQDARTGHTYQLVWSPVVITWEEARQQAAAKTWGGMPGHLATITSRDEEDFLWSNFWNWSAHSLYIGASDAEREGVWKWVTGPEAGDVFFEDGRVADFAYANWFHGEPNNMKQGGANGEHVAVWNWNGHMGWNDVEGAGRDNIHGYLVEYPPSKVEAKPSPPAPIPRHTFLIRDAKLQPPVAEPAPAPAETSH
jgi:hypothetical protein